MEHKNKGKFLLFINEIRIPFSWFSPLNPGYPPWLGISVSLPVSRKIPAVGCLSEW